MAWKVDWRVVVNGMDVTSKWLNVLIDIEISDQAGTTSDSCSLTIDDTEGQIRLPPAGASIEVYLQGALAFAGTIEVPRSRGSRSAGRTITISAKSVDSSSKAKEPQNFDLDDASLEQFLGQAAKNAGYYLEMDPAFASIARDYWSSEGESFIKLGERTARKLGGTFKIRGGRAVLAKAGSGSTPGGQSLPSVTAEWGKNLIGWEIAPRDPRRVFKGASAKWFDRETAAFAMERLDFEDDRSDADNVLRTTVGDAEEAKQSNEARQGESKREDGGGSVDLDLTIEAKVEGLLILRGARPGVDGTYRISTVKHKASRSGGSITSLEVKEPDGGADEDER